MFKWNSKTKNPTTHMPCNWSAIRNSEIAGSNTINELRIGLFQCSFYLSQNQKNLSAKKNTANICETLQNEVVHSPIKQLILVTLFLLFFFHDMKYNNDKYEQWKVKWNWNPINVYNNASTRKIQIIHFIVNLRWKWVNGFGDLVSAIQCCILVNFFLQKPVF